MKSLMLIKQNCDLWPSRFEKKIDSLSHGLYDIITFLIKS